MKRQLQSLFPFFDPNALDAARFFFGTDLPEVELHDGDRTVADYLNDMAFEDLEMPEENDVAYYFRIDSASKITIVKRRAYLKSVSVLTSPYSNKEYIEEIAIEDLSLNTSYVSYNFDHATNCLYITTSSASYKDAKAGKYTGKGVFTVTEVKSGIGSTTGWGKLKSGAGWISLDFAAKI